MRILLILSILLLNTLTIAAYHQPYETCSDSNSTSENILLSGVSVLIFLVTCLIGVIKKWLSSKNKDKE